MKINNKMETIAFVLPSLKTGGGNRVFIELANKLIEKYNIIIVYPNNSTDSNNFKIDSNIILKPIGKEASSNKRKLLNLAQTIKYLNNHHKIDTVIITDPIFSLFSRLIKVYELYRFTQIDDYRIFDDGAILGCGIKLKIYKYLCLKSYQHKIKFIFNSRYVYDMFCKDSNRSDLPFNLVHPSIDNKIFNNENRLLSLKPNICLVARKHPWKGFSNFINTWNSLSEDTTNKIGEVFIISHDDLSQFSIKDMTVIRPKTDKEIAEVYKKSDIFISTSWVEGFGLPPLEAMACGCACIISDSKGVNEYAVNSQNCLMYPPKDINALKEKIELLVNNSDLRKTLSQNGVKTSRNFNWNISANQLIDILNNKDHLPEN